MQTLTYGQTHRKQEPHGELMRMIMTIVKKYKNEKTFTDI